MFKGENKAMAKEIVAMILAGGRGSRLYALTQKTAKPAVSFGGKYRIDITRAEYSELMPIGEPSFFHKIKTEY